MLSCPPSGAPIAHGEPGSVGPGANVLFGPLRNVVPIGWIRREVDHVEAHRRGRFQAFV